jgi:ATP-dependent DNA helicase RecQ
LGSGSLAPNLMTAADLLLEGPRTPADLAGLLRAAGVVMPAARLARLPERYPDAFGWDTQGRLCIPSDLSEDPGAPGGEPDADDAGPAWARVPTPAPITVDELAVLHHGGGTFAVARLRDGAARVFTTDDADVREFLTGVVAVVGHGAPAVDLPGEYVDLRLLELLHDPAGVADPLPGLEPLAGVAVLADRLRSLLDESDRTDASWALARACLVAGGSPLARILPGGLLPAGPTDGLTCADDPLLTLPGEQLPHRSAAEAVRYGLGLLTALGYATRPAQQEMARSVADVLDQGGLLAVEAPTGTGKSLAYLTAAAGRAAAAGKPVVVATATKVLQQQLRRDVTRMQREGLFPAPLRQLFGVGNYICPREVAAGLETTGPDAGPDHWLALAVAVRALATAPGGVWDDVADGAVSRARPDYLATRQTLRTDARSCERRSCPYVAQCPLYRRLAGIRERPGVVVVNHALVATWAKLAEQGGRSPGDVLREGTSDLIFDEAHDLEDSLTSAWTESVGRWELLTSAARVDGRFGLDRHLRLLARRGTDLRGTTALPQLTRTLRDQCDALTDAVVVYVHEYGGANRSAVLRHGIVQTRPEYHRVVEQARLAVVTLRRLGAELVKVETACRAAQTSVAQNQRGLLQTILTRTAGLQQAVDEATEVMARLRDLPDDHLWVHQLVAGSGDEDDERPDWRFESVPIEVGAAFAAGVVRPARSVTLTSATLTVGETFDFLAARLGVRVEPGRSESGVFDGRRLRSPFDYAGQSAVVLTNHLPVPVPSQEREFVEEFARDQVGLLSLTGGKAMTLFAARHRMRAVADLVRQQDEALAAHGVHLLVQGEAGPADIARRFRAEPGSVVYGLRSYWQGFDAPGDTLSYLVIEKPPYPHPDDAVVAARARAVADRGGDPFLEYLVPKTAVLMAQGFGRLIRTETDRGVALIGDRRMQSPGTANRILLATLPGPVVHHAEDRDDAWRFALRFVTGEEPDLSAALRLAGSDVDAALHRLRLTDGEDPEPKLREGARVLFGIDELHEPQVRLMLAHLAGHDTIGILPTGMGKSLCFQLPALLRAPDRATVVVSPLVALIKDQLDGLRGRLGIRPVQGITGTTPATVRNEILRDVAAGKVRLLYVSPERLVRDPVLRVALERQELAGLVVDEAHCISDWGHDFRPEFRRVSQAVAHLNRAPRMALTATAAPPVARDIAATLEMPTPVSVSLPSDRPNLRFRVVKVSGERERARELLRVVTAMGSVPGIVYASRRAVTEEIAALLRRAGVSARHYHAGMVPEQREAVQDDFLAGTTQVIVATKAFGMGVNKPDIAWVVHFGLPESLDAYVQEAGRAARAAELTGECVLLYTGGDIARRRSHLVDAGDTDRLAHTRVLLNLLATQRSRGASVVFDAEEMADAAGVEPDELNVLLAWLERSGALQQLPDCSARGTVHAGLREPADLAERRRFREISVLLRLRPQVSSRIDFDRLGEQHGLDLDELEQSLVAWSLDRLITFSSSQRYRRVVLRAAEVDETALRREIRAWNAWQREQLDAVVAYAAATGCRRAVVIGHFGFPARSCRADDRACDNCGGRSPWQDLPNGAVPDPEQLVNVDVVVLQAVSWSAGQGTGRYGAAGLKAAVLGSEAGPGGHRIGAGLRRCPQFGALRHVRGADRRFDDAVARLTDAGYLAAVDAHRDGRAYRSLVITSAGQERLGVRYG